MVLCVAAAPAMAREDVPADWHKVATPADRGRLRTWRQAWTEALAKARAAGHGREIAAQGALFDPDRALAGAKPPAGDYRCRVFKLGGQRPGNRDFVAYPPFRCRIDPEGQTLSFYKIGGSQRPVGLVFDDGGYRQIFLGTLMLGDERGAIDYGRDASRDMAGLVERIGPHRWRMVLPYPHFESLLDVIELVPMR
ncbi:MAG: DUF4893 domain-containing protein [Sphingomonas sp.]|uniref:DUF4893 domain-containing protein n=1 Tax=Sphingomonas sp. TaxID=28214 RepID=UPI003F7F1362